jgi:alanine dehydrogenase
MFHYRVHNSPPLVPVLSQVNTVHTTQLYFLRFILQRVEPLLCNNREISKYTKAVSRQWLGNLVPTVRDRHARIYVVLETVFSTLPVQMVYKN